MRAEAREQCEVVIDPQSLNIDREERDREVSPYPD
jgi:hypothetical protein